MTKHAVLFDMDGVLIDSNPAHYAAWKSLAKERGIDLSYEKFVETLGADTKYCVPYLLGGEWDDKSLAEISIYKEEVFRKLFADNFHPIPGVSDLIKSLYDAGWLLGLATSAPKANAELTMKLLPEADKIKYRVDVDMVKKAKPDPEIFLTAAKMAGVEPAKSIVIEDSINGLIGARKGGMKAVGLTSSFSREELGEYADLIVDSLVELNPTILEKLIL